MSIFLSNRTVELEPMVPLRLLHYMISKSTMQQDFEMTFQDQDQIQCCDYFFGDLHRFKL